MAYRIPVINQNERFLDINEGQSGSVGSGVQ